ncbi:unnamed protein product [Choristocarpus tenellus]
MYCNFRAHSLSPPVSLLLFTRMPSAATTTPKSVWTQKPQSVTEKPGMRLPMENALMVRGGDVKPPLGLYENAVAVGEKKATGSCQNTLMLGFISGCHIAFGGLLALTVGANIPAMATANPGLQKLLFGIFGLPFGLYMVIVGGGELFTGNTAVVTAALIEGKATVKQLIKNWTLSYAGNLLGSLFLAYLAVLAGINSSPDAAAKIVVAKCASPFLKTVLKGIVCNWMVCMAVWVATGTSGLTEKYLAMVLPVSAFVAFGAEHSVANMFLLPIGKLSGGNASWLDIFVKNILPVTLGNILGGAVMQAGLYSAVYGSLLK